MCVQMCLQSSLIFQNQGVEFQDVIKQIYEEGKCLAIKEVIESKSWYGKADKYNSGKSWE